MKDAIAQDSPARATAGTVITFPRGILGFEDTKSFILQRQHGWEPFAKLVSADDPRLEFVIAPPRTFVADYNVRIDPLEIAELNLSDSGQIDLWVIATIPDDPSQISVNLQGPLVINRENGIAKQLVLTRSHYSTSHLIIDDSADAACRSTGAITAIG